jgi:hypothetical protein
VGQAGNRQQQQEDESCGIAHRVKWHAHLAREFTGGTPVLPTSPKAWHRRPDS